MMLVHLLFKWLALLWDQVALVLPGLVTSFFSVLVGALPFIVIAAFASAALEVFVSKDAIARLLPRNGLLGIFFAPVLGLFIPMCECGIVPVSRRMIQKGVPGAAAVTFMLANPILNPLSIYSTYLAFPFARHMVWWRIGLGYLVSVLIGLVMQFWLRRSHGESILHDDYRIPVAAAQEGAPTGEGGHEHEHGHGGRFATRMQACLDHAATEFFDVLKYFVAGSGLAALSQALIDRQLLEGVGRSPVASVLVMVAFAFVICICSEADAFVAATFAGSFTPGALLAFLVVGPMTDIKNTMMMASAFQRRVVIVLNALIMLFTIGLTIGLNHWLKWGG